MNHVLKQRVQWRIQMLPDLIEKLRGLVRSQFSEADRALCARGDFSLQAEYARHRIPADVWGTMTNAQRQRARDACFTLPHQASAGVSQSLSTDGDLKVQYKHGAGKKVNQKRRARADRTVPSKRVKI
jgi:hypothetical protein